MEGLASTQALSSQKVNEGCLLTGDFPSHGTQAPCALNEDFLPLGLLSLAKLLITGKVAEHLTQLPLQHARHCSQKRPLEPRAGQRIT